MLAFMITFIGKKNLQKGVSKGLNVNKKLRVTKIVLIIEILRKWSWPKLVQRDAAIFEKMQRQLLLPWDMKVG